KDSVKGKPFIIERKGGDIGAANQVRIVKRGNGVLYASATLEYFTRGDAVKEQSVPNLKLTREYLRLKVKDNKWVTEPLTGDIRSGDLIISLLKLSGARSQYVMVEDPIPAGCEQITKFESISFDDSNHQWTDWYSNREFRDQRTVIFTNYFSGNTT